MKATFTQQDLWDFGVWLRQRPLSRDVLTMDKLISLWWEDVERENEAEIQNNMKEE